jgi:hypothetical protein
MARHGAWESIKAPSAPSGHRVGMGESRSHWQWTGVAAQCSFRFSWAEMAAFFGVRRALDKERPHGSQGAAWQAAARLPGQPKKGTTVQRLNECPVFVIAFEFDVVPESDTHTALHLWLSFGQALQWVKSGWQYSVLYSNPRSDEEIWRGGVGGGGKRCELHNHNQSSKLPIPVQCCHGQQYRAPLLFPLSWHCANHSSSSATHSTNARHALKDKGLPFYSISDHESDS